MKPHTFSVQDPIVVLGFLARLKMACENNGITERAGVLFCQFYLTGKAQALLQSRLNSDTMAVHVGQCEMLKTYPEVVNLLLRTYGTNVEIAGAVCDVTSFRQSSNMTVAFHSNHFWYCSRTRTEVTC